jgi:uncharacterized protein YacL
MGGLALASGGYLASTLVKTPGPWLGIGLAGVGLLVGLLVTPYVSVRPLWRGWQYLVSLPLPSLLVLIGGLLLGLLAGALVSVPLARLPGLYGTLVPLMIPILLAVFGAALGVSKEQEIRGLFPETRLPAAPDAGTGREQMIVLDTSAIIDGRIADISQTGFLRGTLIIPRFVLDELRHVADSNDALRRNRGRRGLEMLNKLRKESLVPIQVLDVETRDGMEVDSKLVSLAKSLNAPIVTTDFNLNRVAELQGVKALNINELANSLKPVVIPGEGMLVQVIQEGREPGQGVGFLDDGTMVVVEGGKRYLNSHVDVNITRVLQTAAGRIIFAQPKEGTRNGR